MKLKPYPEYKDSGIPWFGQIPKNWNILPIAALFKERGEYNIKLSEKQVLSVLRDVGVIPYEEKGKIGNKKSEDISRYKLVKVNDIVINSMNVIIGSVGLSRFAGCLSPIYYVFVGRSNTISIYYYSYIFKMRSFQRSLIRLGKGILSHRMRIPMELLKRERMPIPPIREQTIIANYLFMKEKKIAKFIRNKKRIIQLLKEQKQAIINQGVTKGINPHVKMKPSGIDWIGEIPEHWETKRLKMLYDNLSNQTTNKESNEVYIALENVESWTGKLILPNEETLFESKVKRFCFNDILFGKLRPYLAKVFKANCNGVCSGEFLVLRNYSKEIKPEFMELKLRSVQIIDLINSSTFGAKMPRADWNFIGGILISYPNKEEQKVIINKIKCELKKIDRVITKNQKEIELIQEYRTRLISDVVTGKIDVRGIEVEDIPDEELTEELTTTEGSEISKENSQEVSNAS